MSRRVRPDVLFSVLLLLHAASARAGTPEVLCGASVVGAGSLGGCLDALDQKVRAMIESFENSGKALEAGLGGQLASSIMLARAQFGAELDKQVATADAAAKAFVAGTLAQLAKLETATFNDAQSLTRDIQEAAARIPWARREPAVRPLAQPYFVSRDSGLLRLNFDGNFVDASREGYGASVTIDRGGTRYPQVGNTNYSLAFEIPHAALRRTGHDPKVAEYRRITLTTPYRDNAFYCFLPFLCREQSSFEFTLVALPESPGRVELKTVRPIMVKKPQSTTSPEQTQDSKDDDIPEDKSGKLYCFPPTNGWAIRHATVKGRITNRIEGDEGKDWWWVSNPDSASSATNACVRMQTLKKAWGHSGKVKFVVDFVEEKDFPDVEVLDAPAPVSWGDAQIYPLGVGQKLTGIYYQFDGRTYPFDGPGDIGTPFLNVEATASGNRVSFFVDQGSVEKGPLPVQLRGVARDEREQAPWPIIGAIGALGVAALVVLVARRRTRPSSPGG